MTTLYRVARAASLMHLSENPYSRPAGPDATHPPIISTIGLTKRYGDFSALRECTLNVQRGEVFGLLGPNGAGKTTLLRLLLGFLRPTTGSAQIDGLDCFRDSVQVHARAAYLPGDVRLPPRLRGRDVLEFLAGVRPDGNLERSLELADRLGLDVNRRVSQSSTGMRQKVALAAVLGTTAPLIILDEPTANLDPTVRAEVLKTIRHVRSEGRTVLFSSHVLSETEQVCDRVAVLRSGSVVYVQALASLRRRHAITAQLTGPFPPPPPELADELERLEHGGGMLRIETAGELAPLLGWLASLPLAEVRIEPLGLESVYRQYHGAP